MFEHYAPPVVSLKSTWQKSRQVAAIGVQTKPTKATDNEAQTSESVSQSVQTDDYSRSRYNDEEDGSSNVDWNKLASFLKSVEPIIVRTLEKNRQQVAVFSAYHSTISEFDAQVTLVQTLKHADITQKMQTNSVVWNSSGTTVAAAFGFSAHDDWCSHHGWLCTWNVERRNLNPNKAHWSSEMTSCCTCACFHPSNPSLLAAGSYTGEIVVWSLAEENGEIVGQGGAGGGQQPITNVAWFGAGGSRLAAASSDGRIIVATLPSRGQQLQTTHCFQITVGDLPRVLRGKVAGTGRETGVGCVAFQRNDEERFMATTETGAVFYCNLESRNPLANVVITGVDVPVYDPVILSLKPHTGPVYGAAAAYFGDRKFATCSADGTLCVRDLLKADPLLEIDLNCGAVFGICWSPVRPAVLACATASGKIAVLDLTLSTQKPSVWIEPSSSSSATTSISLNPVRCRLLAAGDSNGVLNVWQLGETFASVSGNEEQVLENLGAADQD